MEKLLNAIASGITVRAIVNEQSNQIINGVEVVKEITFYHKDVSDKVKELFKNALNHHLSIKLQDVKVGTYIDYGFDYIFDHKQKRPLGTLIESSDYVDYGQEKPLGTFIEGANDNLAEVLLTLPALEDGESYEFPCDTYIRFMLTGKADKDATIDPNILCPWIIEAYNKQ